MNTITEIQTALDKLVAAMSEKGVKRPDAQVHIVQGGRFAIHANGAFGTTPFDGRNYFVEHSETVDGLFEIAHEIVAAILSPEEQVTRQYLKHVATAIDYATEHSIADEYVSPLRGVSCAMTENLLTSEVEK